MNREQAPYLSWLLRLWPTRSEGQWIWRASIEDPHTGQRRGFARLKDLFTYLDQETGRRALGQSTPNADEKAGDGERT